MQDGRGNIYGILLREQGGKIPAPGIDGIRRGRVPPSEGEFFAGTKSTFGTVSGNWVRNIVDEILLLHHLQLWLFPVSSQRMMLIMTALWT